MVEIVVAALVLGGTVLQAWVSLSELRETKRPVLDHWNTEDELIAESPRLRRRRTAREVRAMRGEEMDREIRRLNRALMSWVMLAAASGIALAAAVARAAQ